MRTLDYLNDFSLSLSFIRPTLILVSIVGFPLSHLLSPYLVWMLLTILCLALLVHSILRLNSIHKVIVSKKLLLAASANFSAIAFLFVPDTFILSSALFFFGLVLLAKKRNVFWVGSSFLVSCGTNLFFAIPWTAYYFLVVRPSQPIKLFALGAMLPLMFLQGLQWLARKLTPSVASISNSSDSAPPDSSETNPLPSGTWFDSFLSSSDALKWLHSPLDNLQINLLSFLTAPWTVNYSYELGLSPDQSQVLPIWIIFCGMSLTFLSYFGLWQYRRRNRSMFLLLCIVEFSCLILFLTYGPHPYLFSPFLIATRALGVAMLGTTRRLLGALIALLVPLVNLATQASIFQ
jgi:hypothetical protein